jgi:hypothetical protein
MQLDYPVQQLDIDVTNCDGRIDPPNTSSRCTLKIQPLLGIRIDDSTALGSGILIRKKPSSKRTFFHSIIKLVRKSLLLHHYAKMLETTREESNGLPTQGNPCGLSATN